MKKSLLAALLFFLFSGQVLYAEILILKSGRKIEANIIEKNEQFVVIDFKGTPITYYAFEVESIDGEPVVAKPKREDKDIIRAEIISPEEYLKRGNAYYAKEGFEQAIAEFSLAIKIKPDYAEAYLRRGLAEADRANLDQAISDYARALEINPKYEEAYYTRGLAYARKGDIDRALADYSKAIEVNPEYVQAYLNRAFININKALPEKAITDLDRVVKINSNLAVAYYIRGIAYANKGNLEQAISDYSKAIKFNPNYAEAYTNRALAYVYKAMIEQTRIDPNSPKAYVNIGPTKANKADFDRAVSDCNKALEISPSFSDAYLARARVYFFRQEYDKSWEDVHKLEELGAKIDPQFLGDLKTASGKEK